MDACDHDDDADPWKVECPPVELKDLPPICPRWPDVDYLPESLGAHGLLGDFLKGH